MVNELTKRRLIHEGALTVNGHTIGENCKGTQSGDADVIFPIDAPMKAEAGFIVLRGNLFDNAIMKTSVIDEEFRDRYLSNPKDPNAFEGRAIVFEGPEDYHAPDRRSGARHRRDTASCSSAARGRSAIPAAPRW